MKKILPLVLVFALILAGSVQAQGEEPEDPLAVLGTGFTYQGWLSDDAGSPLNGTCDFNFSLWDALADGAQVGAVSPVTNVAVTEGYFSAVVNGAAEFGSNAFKGSARWLEVSLRCPAGAGGYTTLSPRQALTAAPYARYAVNAPWSGLSGVPADLADGDNDTTYAAGTGITLSGGAFSLGTAYRLPQSCTDGQIAEWDTGTSAWICAADNTNSGDITGVTAGTGLTGGGTSGAVTLALGTTYQLPQSCTDGQPAEWDTGTSLWTCGTDGTGSDWHLTGNSGTDPASNFIGTTGDQDLVFKVNSSTALRIEPDATSPNIIGGSEANHVDADVHGATIGGGGSSVGYNYVGENYGTVGGGYNNGVADDYGTVSGGRDNTAYWEGGTIGGGNNNTAGQFYATVSGGRDNNAADYYSAIGGGEGNSAQGEYSTIPGGKDAYARFYGQAAQASGAFASQGDAQASTLVLRNTSTSITYQTLYLDGSGDVFWVSSGRTMALDILIVGRTEEGESAAYQITGVVENVGGTAVFIGLPTETILGEDDTAWDVSISLSSYYVYIKARGNNETVRWVAVVRTAEVGWVP